jgi:hypothetical protein
MEDPRTTKIEVQLETSLLGTLVEKLAEDMHEWLGVDCGLELVHTEESLEAMHVLKFNIWTTPGENQEYLGFVTGHLARNGYGPTSVEHITIRTPDAEKYEARDPHVAMLDYGDVETVRGALHVATGTTTTTIQGT